MSINVIIVIFQKYNSGKCLLSTFLLSVREIHESFAPLKHMQNTELAHFSLSTLLSEVKDPTSYFPCPHYFQWSFTIFSKPKIVAPQKSVQTLGAILVSLSANPTSSSEVWTLFLGHPVRIVLRNNFSLLSLL